jgi:hypothetical protein
MRRREFNAGLGGAAAPPPGGEGGTPKDRKKLRKATPTACDSSALARANALGDSRCLAH